jgi:hypothetical protein
MIVNTKFQICIRAIRRRFAAAQEKLVCEVHFGLPENKKAIAAAPNVSAPTCAYSECITSARAELLSSMAPTATAQEGTQPEKHGTKKRYNL